MSGGGDAIVVLNAGSSSIKFSAFRRGAGGLERELRGQVAGLGTTPRLTVRRGTEPVTGRDFGDSDTSHAEALAVLLDVLREELHGETIVGVGHRVVHGGLEFMAPTRVDAGILQRLRRYVPLAPLHQSHNLAAIELMLERLPGVPEIACFDTAFHRTVPEVAQRFALPPRFAAAGIRRYGFHGLSYEYVATVLPGLDARAAAGRTVVFHLGNGSSMCALSGGRSIATTMGFTAVDGLPMGTRTGAIDPGVLLYLMDYGGMDVKALTRLLYKESGLLGVSGISQDMRELLASGKPEAAEAVELFCYRIVREIGSLAAALGGLDALVFTGGIGEHAAPVRERVCAKLGWLGVELDPAANAADAKVISTASSRTVAMVLPTNEEWMLARHTAELI